MRLNEGFFTRRETESKDLPGGKKLTCVTCGLRRTCNTPKMKPYGNFKKKIMNIGDAPNEHDDKYGKPFHSKIGKLLQNTYDKFDIDLFDDCININAVNCLPRDEHGSVKTPTNLEVDCCRKQVLQYIEEYKPNVIIILGNTALYSLIGHRWRKDLGSITKWRGFQIPDRDYNAWLCPTFHPKFIEKAFELPASFKGKRKRNPIENLIWEEDLLSAFNLATEKVPLPKYVEPKIEIIEDLSVLYDIKGESAFDYETTGLKPHADGHRVICCAIADTENHAYAFLIPKTKRKRQPLLDYLTNPKQKKIAQNLKYEHTWSKVRLLDQDIEVQGWEWDTMLATHVFDNRPGITGLKFQVYVQFGIVDYTSDVDTYMGSIDPNSGNSLNKIPELLEKPGGKEALLKYCGLDAVYELRLANLQREHILPF